MLLNKLPMGKIIAVDFDGTLCSFNYPNIGKPNRRLINKLKKLKPLGNTLILWTCRTGRELREAVAWCKEQGLHFDYVNRNSDQILKLYNNRDSRKITADIYIDDKAVKTL